MTLEIVPALTYHDTSSLFFIHSANPQPRPVVIIVFVHVVRTSVPTFQI